MLAGVLTSSTRPSGPTEWIFEAPINEVTSSTRSWRGFANRIILSDYDFEITEKADKRKNPSDKDGDRPDGTALGSDRPLLILRGRNFVNSVLDRVDLRFADFTGSNLRGASFVRSRLNGADFGCADTERPNRRETYKDLDDLRRSRARTQCSILDDAELNLSDLSDAKLLGASLRKHIASQCGC